MTQPLIDVVNVCKSFGTKAVLDHLTLRVPPGVAVGLLGSNGAGKSTLLKTLVGLLRADSGESKILGEHSWILSAEAKANLGYVPQQVRLYPWMKVGNMIRYTSAFYPRWSTALVDSLVDRLEIDLKQRVGAMSVGQAQKLAAVLAMGSEPKLLILDEPFASLDPASRRELLDILIEFMATGDRSILFSTHITTDLERVATHVAFLRDGQISLYDEVDSIKDRFKRLHLFANDPFPHTFGMANAMRTSVDGQHAIVVLSDAVPDVVSELGRTWNAEVRVEDLNLEEIFLEVEGKAGGR